MEVHSTRRWKPHPDHTHKNMGVLRLRFQRAGPYRFLKKTNILMMHSQTNFFVPKADRQAGRQAVGVGRGLREGEQGQGDLLCCTSLGSRAR